MNFQYLALGLGVASYCLLLLISRDAPIENIALLGCGSLALIFISMWRLWMGVETGDEPDVS